MSNHNVRTCPWYLSVKTISPVTHILLVIIVLDLLYVTFHNFMTQLKQSWKNVNKLCSWRNFIFLSSFSTLASVSCVGVPRGCATCFCFTDQTIFLSCLVHRACMTENGDSTLTHSSQSKRLISSHHISSHQTSNLNPNVDPLEGTSKQTAMVKPDEIIPAKNKWCSSCLEYCSLGNKELQNSLFSEETNKNLHKNTANLNLNKLKTLKSYLSHS